MRGADILTAPAAEKVREHWHDWASHARTCQSCVSVLASILKEPTQNVHLLHGRCCGEGADLYDRWVVAVNEMVAHLRRNRQPVGAPR